MIVKQLLLYVTIHADDQWSGFVLEEAKEWQRIIQSWMVDDLNHPVLAVWYEELRLDAAVELKRMLDFLQVPYNTFIVEELALSFQEDRPSNMNMYTANQINYINSIIKSTIETLADSSIDSEYLSSYLRHSS